jgi:hypothetical protein
MDPVCLVMGAGAGIATWASVAKAAITRCCAGAATHRTRAAGTRD